MRLTSLIPASLFLCIVVPVIRADDASKIAKVEEFFRISHTEQMISQSMTMSMDQMKSGMFQQMMGLKLSAEQNKIVEELQARVSKILSDAMAWEQIKPSYVKIFADAYTDQQLDDILAFYRSPTGQAMVTKNPGLMTKASEIVQQRIMLVQPEMQKLMVEFGDKARATTTPKPR